MRTLLFILTALIAIPADAEVYVYDYAGYLESNSLIGSSGDTYHGTFSFYTEMPLWYIGSWGEPGDTAYYWDRDVTGLAPQLSYINDNSGVKILSSEAYSRIQITNDHYMYGDFFIIYSSHLQSSDISVNIGSSMGVSLRDSGDAITSIDIPHGLPLLDAFDNAGLTLNGGRVGLITEMMWIPSGDLDRDGFVGLYDLDTILQAWNQNVTMVDSSADPSGDGYVGLDDLDIVLSNWNAGTPPIFNTPEPATPLLIVFGLATVMMHARTNR